MAQEYVDNDNDLVLPDELLSSMAESLMTEATFYTVPVKQDAPPVQYGTNKQHTDLFYRKMPWTLMKPPMNVSQRRCSCMYLCTGAVAVIKCSSCAAMDVRNVGYYCQACFNSRHPWYRVPHVFINIEDDEASEFNRAHAAFKTGLKRCENEGKLMMNNLHKQKERLGLIADDEDVDNGLRDVGRKVVDVETKLRELQRTLRQDIRKKDLKFCEDNGVLGAKTPYRDPNNLSAVASKAGTKANNSRVTSPRKAMSRLQSPATSRPGTAAPKPKLPPPSTKKRQTLVLTEEQRMERDFKIHQALCTPVYIPMSPDEGVAVLQRYWRRYTIQLRVSELYCRTIITKIFDDESGRFYYHNSKSGVSMWCLPRALVLKRHIRFIRDHTYKHLELAAEASRATRSISTSADSNDGKPEGWPLLLQDSSAAGTVGNVASVVDVAIPVNSVVDVAIPVNSVVDVAIPVNYWYCKLLRLRNGRRRHRHRRRTIVGAKRACEVLQGFGRCVCARLKVLDLAYRIYTRVLDETSGGYFYYNLATGASQWEKPYGIFLKSTNPEPYVINPADVATASAGVNNSDYVEGDALASARDNVSASGAGVGVSTGASGPASRQTSARGGMASSACGPNASASASAAVSRSGSTRHMYQDSKNSARGASANGASASAACGLSVSASASAAVSRSGSTRQIYQDSSKNAKSGDISVENVFAHIRGRNPSVNALLDNMASQPGETPAYLDDDCSIESLEMDMKSFDSNGGGIGIGIGIAGVVVDSVDIIVSGSNSNRRANANNYEQHVESLTRRAPPAEVAYTPPVSSKRKPLNSCDLTPRSGADEF